MGLFLICKTIKQTNKQTLCTDYGMYTSHQHRKDLLKTSNLLIHYDSTLPIRLATDASQYGLGAIISHVLVWKNLLLFPLELCQIVNKTTPISIKRP